MMTSRACTGLGRPRIRLLFNGTVETGYTRQCLGIIPEDCVLPLITGDFVVVTWCVPPPLYMLSPRTSLVSLSARRVPRYAGWNPG